MLHCPLPFETYDRDGLDYSLVINGGIEHRGPAVNLDEPYRVCLGTAMTFGRYVLRPYPALIGALNLGYGRLDLERFRASRPHLNILANAAEAIVQFSPRPCYLDGVARILAELRCPKTLLVFLNTQSPQPGQLEALTPLTDRVVAVPGDSVWEWYPSQETHDRAAQSILALRSVTALRPTL